MTSVLCRSGTTSLVMECVLVAVFSMATASEVFWVGDQAVLPAGAARYPGQYVPARSFVGENLVCGRFVEPDEVRIAFEGNPYTTIGDYQYLAYRASPATELVWVPSGVGEVPDGAITCGVTVDGHVLYQAMSISIPSGYDVTTACLDLPYAPNITPCRNSWDILTLKHMSNLTFLSYHPPSCPLDQSSVVSPTEFANLFDDNEETCHDFSDAKHLTLSFAFLSHDSGINHFRCVMNASQDCTSDNFLWFAGGASSSTCTKHLQCEVSQDMTNGYKICNVTCLCACLSECGYVHLFVQQIPWEQNYQLGICHWEHVLTGQVVEPEVVD